MLKTPSKACMSSKKSLNAPFKTRSSAGPFLGFVLPFFGLVSLHCGGGGGGCGACMSNGGGGGVS